MQAPCPQLNTAPQLVWINYWMGKTQCTKRDQLWSLEIGLCIFGWISDHSPPLLQYLLPKQPPESLQSLFGNWILLLQLDCLQANPVAPQPTEFVLAQKLMSGVLSINSWAPLTTNGNKQKTCLWRFGVQNICADAFGVRFLVCICDPAFADGVEQKAALQVLGFWGLAQLAFK